MTLLTVLLCLVPLAAFAQVPDADKSQITAQVMKLQTGWNAGSGDTFAEPFAEDADYVVINGVHIVGKKAIAGGHQQIFDSIYKNTTLALKVEKVRMIKPDVATVIAYAERTNQDKSIDKARMTIVIVKTEGEWLIQNFQNTAVLPMPQ